MTALAAACFAIGYLLVYAGVASGVNEKGHRIGGWYADRPWQALFGPEPPQSAAEAQGKTASRTTGA